MASPTLSLSAPAQNLKRLLLIRTLALCGLAGACAASFWLLQLSLPYNTLLWILAVVAVITAFTWIRLHQLWPVTNTEFFGQLLIDLMSTGLLLYFSGGASNPFISYLLIPVCIAAATLKTLPSSLIACAALAIYSSLLFFNLPIPALAPSHDHHAAPMNLHIVGMWLNFVISALLITYFVAAMAKALRQQQEQIHHHREDNLRDEQLLATATLAAGTAHELGTPLSTMKVLLKEMQQDYCDSDHKNLSEDLQLLSTQLNQCSCTLKQLVHKAEQAKDGQLPLQPVKTFCQQILDRWLLLNPSVDAGIHYREENPEVESHFHPTIAQSMLNLLNNAADAEPRGIEVSVTISNAELQLCIEDNGPGIPLELADKIGTPFIGSKEKGFGLGLFLSHATINRCGGSIRLYNRKEGGTLTELKLPLNRGISVP